MRRRHLHDLVVLDVAGVFLPFHFNHPVLDVFDDLLWKNSPKVGHFLDEFPDHGWESQGVRSDGPLVFLENLLEKHSCDMI